MFPFWKACASRRKRLIPHVDLDFITRGVLESGFPALVGRAMTCQRCGNILDCRDAVEVSVYQKDTLSRCFYLCGDCFDASEASIVAAVKPFKPEVRLEHVDGRVLMREESHE